MTMGKIEGKISRGHQIVQTLDGLAAWLGNNIMEVFEDTSCEMADHNRQARHSVIMIITLPIAYGQW